MAHGDAALPIGMAFYKHYYFVIVANEEGGRALSEFVVKADNCFSLKPPNKTSFFSGTLASLSQAVRCG